MTMIDLPFSTIEEGENETSRTYRIDWEKGRIIGFVDNLEALQQFIKKALLTPRFKCLIYNHEYGSEIRDTVINPVSTKEYMQAEIPFLVCDALIHDERILKVYNVQIEFGDTYPLQDSVFISFDVDTIYGQTSMREVI